MFSRDSFGTICWKYIKCEILSDGVERLTIWFYQVELNWWTYLEPPQKLNVLIFTAGGTSQQYDDIFLKKVAVNAETGQGKEKTHTFLSQQKEIKT